MTRNAHRHVQPDGAYLVAAPRKTDAVGWTLRTAFADTPRLPAEMAMMLARLDRIGHA